MRDLRPPERQQRVGPLGPWVSGPITNSSALRVLGFEEYAMYG
jgi:hypothetical protein